MRGILLLALGAGLIWLGLSTAPKTGASGGNESGVADLDVPGTYDSAGDDLGSDDPGGSYGGGENFVGPARPASPDEFGPAPEQGAEAGGSEGPSGADPGSEAALLMANENPTEPEVGVPVYVDPIAAEILEQDDPVLEDVQPDAVGDAPGPDFALEWNGGAAAPDLTQGQDDETPSYRLGDPRSNPVGLAALLLESWIQGDPTALELRLNDTENPVPLNQRRLVYGFWQGISRDPSIAAGEAEALRDEQEGLTAAQLGLLGAAGNGQANRPVPAASGHRDPLARAMRMVLLDVRATRSKERGDHPLAARSCSDLIQLELTAPWAPHKPTLLRWAAALNSAQAQHRLHRDGEWPALERIVRANDSLSEIRQDIVRQNPSLLVCDGLITKVNNLGKYIHPGDRLRIPTEAPNVVVDLDARLAVYRHGSEAVMAWEVGIGKEGHATPPGIYAVGIKQTNPTHWIAGGEVPYGHPDNPLGTHWIEWVQDGHGTHLGFHGTKEPAGVGGRVSLGCIRMRNEEVKQLFDLLPVGSRVEVRP